MVFINIHGIDILITILINPIRWFIMVFSTITIINGPFPMFGQTQI